MARNQSDRQSAAADPRNRLNDLSNKEWMIATKSVWRSEGVGAPGPSDREREEIAAWLAERYGVDRAAEMLGQLLPSVIASRPGPRDELKCLHPATFAESDVERLIRFFTKAGDRVLDPFAGSGSTLVACQAAGRSGAGIELAPRWVEIARKRIGGDRRSCAGAASAGAASAGATGVKAPRSDEGLPLEILEGDARSALAAFGDASFDFVVTSPPYWKILHKDTDHKVTRERVERGLDTRYSELEADLGNIGSYEDFLAELEKVFVECCRVLRRDRYMCVIVSDFRDASHFIAYHADISRLIEGCGFALQGLTVLVQDNKNLYPYGIPFAFVSNINHQFILVFRRARLASRVGAAL